MAVSQPAGLDIPFESSTAAMGVGGRTLPRALSSTRDRTTSARRVALDLWARAP